MTVPIPNAEQRRIIDGLKTLVATVENAYAEGHAEGVREGLAQAEQVVREIDECGFDRTPDWYAALTEAADRIKALREGQV